MAPALLRIENVSQALGRVAALGGVSLEVHRGEVHALLGDNGAGKSTLVSILAGIHPPTSGQLYLDGQSVRFSSPRDASNAGIGTAFQDLALNPLSSVARNFFMGRERIIGLRPFGLLKMKEMDRVTGEALARIGIVDCDPSQPVGTLSKDRQQMLAIARASYFGAKVLILDEPTAALGREQQREVLEAIVRVARAGQVAVILITHDTTHAQRVADRYTCLRLGKVTGRGPAATMDHDEVRRLIADGAEPPDPAQPLAAIS